jgi:hypothetical protein
MYYKTLFREGLLHTDTAWDDLPGYYQTAWNLIETAQQKSHPLEGSSQEAIPLPSTTFDFFSVVFYLAHSTPPWPSPTHPCFHSRGVDAHAPHQSPIRIKAS